MEGNGLQIISFKGIKGKAGAWRIDTKVVTKPSKEKAFRTEKERREWQRLLQKDMARRESVA